jgi:hypothetical protein
MLYVAVNLGVLCLGIMVAGLLLPLECIEIHSLPFKNFRK